MLGYSNNYCFSGVYSSMWDVVLQFGRNSNLRELSLGLPPLLFVVHLLYQRIPNWILSYHNHIQLSFWNRRRYRIRWGEKVISGYTWNSISRNAPWMSDTAYYCLRKWVLISTILFQNSFGLGQKVALEQHSAETFTNFPHLVPQKCCIMYSWYIQWRISDYPFHRHFSECLCEVNRSCFWESRNNSTFAETRFFANLEWPEKWNKRMYLGSYDI